MRSLFGLFESLNEWVYVADMDTYELTFMNAYLRRAYGFSSHEEYFGKKCYTVLQGRTEPCIFCTNNRLCTGKFYEWSYTNPILDKTFILKDTMYEESGHRYRLELAIDASSERENDEKESLLAYGDSLINDCVRKTFSLNDPNEAIDQILFFIGERFRCERVYIFEIEDGEMFSNTYEWCAPGVVPQKDVLQHEPLETVDHWFKFFEEDKPVIIEDVEDIRLQNPEIYAVLKPQNIQSLVAVSIQSGKRINGFLGVDNPKGEKYNIITHFLFVIAHFIASLIERRNLLEYLEHMSYHDQLTGSNNRHAFRKMIESISNEKSVGVLYGDISGLKKVNDNLGHEAGDAMIIHFYRLLRHYFAAEEIFRTGGDEFVVICVGTLEKDFQERASKLKEEVSRDEYHLSLGWAWEPKLFQSIHLLLNRAETRMYEDKGKYYAKKRMVSSRDIRGTRHHPNLFANISKDSSIYQFIRNNYFDVETLFRSVTVEDAPYYLYFGDLQTNFFYISDNMRDRFAFKSNIVLDLISVWEQKINSKEELEQYRRDFEMILSEKREKHDLRYRVKDKDGDYIWIRCVGIVKWNEDKSIPLFFSGFISYQERDFIVDSVTSFPREQAATLKILELQEKAKPITIVGFALNHFDEINELKGRHNGNLLLKSIAQRLIRHFDENISFYRLDGLRFMGILSSTCEYRLEEIIEQIRDIVVAQYRHNGITVRIPCSLGAFYEESSKMQPQEIIVNVTGLLAEAKNSPEKEYIVHSQKTIRMQKDHAQMVMALNRNILNDFEGFRIVVQPAVSAENDEIISGESLLRWRFNGADVSPLVFIPILEKNKLIIPLGKWLFEKVVRTCKRISTHHADFKLSFNVSYHQVFDKEFFPYMKRILEKYHLDGHRLIMELTETHFDEAPELLEEFIANCKSIGISVALDDFGNGYSSIGLLLKYPSNIVKLDKSLLTSMTTSEDNINFISSIVYACHRFGKEVCAEGVETIEEVQIIKGTGCDLIQGYYYYRPMEIRDLLQLLAEKEKKKI